MVNLQPGYQTNHSLAFQNVSAGIIPFTNASYLLYPQSARRFIIAVLRLRLIYDWLKAALWRSLRLHSATTNVRTALENVRQFKGGKMRAVPHFHAQ